MKYALLLFFFSAALLACSGSVATPETACVVGQDQTCNDNAEVSSLWGACQADGTCACHPGFEPASGTGRCRPAPDSGVPDSGAPDSGAPDSGALDSGAPDSGALDGGAPDGGPFACGTTTCMGDQFCVQRVHSQDAGPKPPTWMCQNYFNCVDHTCACGLASFISASCISPVCTSASPVVIRCDDLN